MNGVYEVDRAKWSTLDIFNQMGNIYSEVGRTFTSSGTNRIQAMSRAIDLFDATADSLAKLKSPKLKEVLRAKEEYLRIANAHYLDQTDIQGLDRYFMHFAVAARLRSVHD